MGYYFLIIWYWWVILLTLSALGLDLKAGRLEELSSADYFLLGRICQNLKGSLIGQVLDEVRKQLNKTEPAGEAVENHAILNMEVNTQETKLPKLVLTD